MLLSSCRNAVWVLKSWEKLEAVQWWLSLLKPFCKFLLNMNQLLFSRGLQVGQIGELLQAWVFPSTRFTFLTNTKPLLRNFTWNKKWTARELVHRGAQSAWYVWAQTVSFTKVMITLTFRYFLVCAHFHFLFPSSALCTYIRSWADFNPLEIRVGKGKCISSEKSLESITVK